MDLKSNRIRSLVYNDNFPKNRFIRTIRIRKIVVLDQSTVEAIDKIKMMKNLPQSVLGLTGVSPGDVLLRVNDETVLGRPHQEVVKMFSQVAPGQTAALQLLRGYPLPVEVEAELDVPQPIENTGLSYRQGILNMN